MRKHFNPLIPVFFKNILRFNSAFFEPLSVSKNSTTSVVVFQR
ncbi:hypothetical protein HMPREF1403_01290 [Helicobacter pylori GAM201Ai]|nr:hypothetical protein HMPREF1403_01290 [Helicobacter pylori GAM201Ai]